MHRGSRPSGERGITLVELMIVVTIIGVLAILAAVGYGKWVASSKTAEAGEMLGAIKNGQENYFSQSGKYLDLSKTITPGDLHPNAKGDKKVPWVDVCSVCKVADGWKKLAVKADKPVYFGYATIAGTEADDPDAGRAPCKASGTDISWNKEAGGKVLKPWYIAGALADTNENGVHAQLCSGSFSQRLFWNNEGE
jgi:type IV pilus assembly protein PilA